MNYKQLIIAIDVVGFFGILAWLSAMTFTKLSLGSTLTFVGAFWKSWATESTTRRQKAKIKVLGLGEFELEGSLRLVMVAAGFILIVAGAFSAKDEVAQQLNKYVGSEADRAPSESDLKR